MNFGKQTLRTFRKALNVLWNTSRKALDGPGKHQKYPRMALDEVKTLPGIHQQHPRMELNERKIDSKASRKALDWAFNQIQR